MGLWYPHWGEISTNSRKAIASLVDPHTRNLTIPRKTMTKNCFLALFSISFGNNEMPPRWDQYNLFIFCGICQTNFTVCSQGRSQLFSVDWEKKEICRYYENSRRTWWSAIFNFNINQNRTAQKRFVSQSVSRFEVAPSVVSKHKRCNPGRWGR